MSEKTSVLKSNLVQRLIAGILGSAFVIFLLLYNFYTFSVFCGLMVFLVLREFYIVTSNYKPLAVLGIIIGFMMLGLAIYTRIEILDYKLLSLVFSTIMAVPIAILFSKDKNMIQSSTSTFMGLLYIVLPVLLLVFMSQNTSISDGYNRFLILGIFLVIWSNDTGAYFAGKTLGKTKLFERVSPNKTIEGSIGGVILASIIITIYYQFIITEHYYSPVFWAVFTFVISIAGIIGDLVESQIKRTLAIKDSGSSIPGHGGFLDRFDALIFAIPFAYICYLFTI